MSVASGAPPSLKPPPTTVLPAVHDAVAVNGPAPVMFVALPVIFSQPDVAEAPVGPAGPTPPIGPVSPLSPFRPWSPLSPLSPLGPCSPGSPFSPLSPFGPFSPLPLPMFSVTSDSPFLHFDPETYRTSPLDERTHSFTVLLLEAA